MRCNSHTVWVIPTLCVCRRETRRWRDRSNSTVRWSHWETGSTPVREPGLLWDVNSMNTSHRGRPRLIERGSWWQPNNRRRSSRNVWQGCCQTLDALLSHMKKQYVNEYKRSFLKCKTRLLWVCTSRYEVSVLTPAGGLQWTIIEMSTSIISQLHAAPDPTRPVGLLISPARVPHHIKCHQTPALCSQISCIPIIVLEPMKLKESLALSMSFAHPFYISCISWPTFVLLSVALCLECNNRS